jgi:hypothetical protein
MNPRSPSTAHRARLVIRLPPAGRRELRVRLGPAAGRSDSRIGAREPAALRVGKGGRRRPRGAPFASGCSGRVLPVQRGSFARLIRLGRGSVVLLRLTVSAPRGGESYRGQPLRRLGLVAFRLSPIPGLATWRDGQTLVGGSGLRLVVCSRWGAVRVPGVGASGARHTEYASRQSQSRRGVGNG